MFPETRDHVYGNPEYPAALPRTSIPLKFMLLRKIDRQKKTFFSRKRTSKVRPESRVCSETNYELRPRCLAMVDFRRAALIQILDRDSLPGRGSLTIDFRAVPKFTCAPPETRCYSSHRCVDS